MAGNIKGLTIEIGGDTTKLDKALKGVNASARDLNSQLREINTSLKFNPKSTELMEQKQRALATAIENTAKKLETLKTAQEQAADALARGDIGQDEYDALRREIIKTENQLKSLNGELKSLESKWVTGGKKIEEYGNKIQSAGEKVGKAGKTLTTKVTAPIVAVGTIAGKAAIDFESAFAGVRKTVEASEEDFAKLEKGIRQMAKELPASAVEIAGVAEAAGQLGIKTENILGFTRVMIDLGEATNMSAEEAATSLARLANITGMPQTEFDKLGSVVVDLGNNFATTEKEIVDMGLRLAGAGAQVGMTEAEIMSFAAALSSVGIEAQAGGSAFSKVMVEMQLATEVGGEKLEEFAAVAGMSAEDFKTAFQEDAAGAIISFVGGLASAEERGQSAIGVLDEMGITEVRLRDALLRAAGAQNVFTDAVATGTAAWDENSALTKEAEERYKTMESRLNILKNNFIDVGISLGERLMPYIERFVEWAQKMADKLGEVNPETMDLAVKIGLVVAAIGPLMMILGPMIKVFGMLVSGIGLFSQAIGVVTAGAAAASPIVAGLAKVIAFMTNPIVGVGLALGTLAFIFYKNWDHIKEYTLIAWEAITGFLLGIWESIRETAISVWTSITEFLSGLWNGFIETVQPIWETLVNVFTVIWMVIEEVFRAAWMIIESFLIVAWQGIANVASAIWQSLEAIFSVVWEKISAVTTEVWEAISGFLLGIWEDIKAAVAPFIDPIKDAIGAAWEAISAKAQEIWTAISTWLSDTWGTISTKASDTWDGISTKLSEIWESIKTRVTAVFDAIKANIEEAWNAISRKASEVWTNIKTKLGDIWDSIKTKVTDVFDSIKTKLSDVWDSIKSAATDAWDAVKEAIEGPINKARDVVGAAIDKIKSFLDIQLPFPKIKLPHFSISGKFSLSPPSIPKFGVEWYDKGGIFSAPSIIGVGEKRPEFVGALDDLKTLMREVIDERGGVGSGVLITGNTFNVRDEEDIESVAEALLRLIERKKRGAGSWA